MEKKHKSWLTCKPTKGEKFDPRSLTEQAGYVPLARRIKEFQAAGLRLQAYRRENYDFMDWNDNDIDNPIPPLRHRACDLLDLHNAKKDLEARLKAQKDQYDTKAREAVKETLRKEIEAERLKAEQNIPPENVKPEKRLKNNPFFGLFT